METPGGNSDSHRPSSSSSNPNSNSNSTTRRFHNNHHHNNNNNRPHFSASNFIRSPISTLLEYSGLLRPAPTSRFPQQHQFHDSDPLLSPSPNPDVPGEVSIRIIGAAEQDTAPASTTTATTADVACPVPSSGGQDELGGTSGVGVSLANNDGTGVESEAADGAGVSNASRDNNNNNGYQRYDIQQAARWIEQILPFSLLLLVVFIRQHLQGFFVTIWIAVVLFKSNDILRKQTALKGERKIAVLVGICIIFTVHVDGVYWWYKNDDLLYPLIMLPPKAIPPFWHAVFIIMVNDTLVRQAAMILKCLLLMYYKDSRGRKYRRQGQMLTLVEYLLLLYRALLPTPVWYRFFLNKEYGSLFSSLMTGLYLTFKLTSVVEKVHSFFTAVKALSRKEIHYGAYATSEQVNAAGDMCAICQEKMHTPILLRCKHLFCEDCVSEWFERERTCPLCRALVKPADLKSFGDGSTSMFFQFF